MLPTISPWGEMSRKGQRVYQSHTISRGRVLPIRWFTSSIPQLQTEKGRRIASLFIHAIKAALDYALSFGVRT